MPIIRPPLLDPSTDLLVQGEQLRQGTFDPTDRSLIQDLTQGYTITGFDNLVSDEDAYPPMNSFIEINRAHVRRGQSDARFIRQNAGIATPCGAWISLEYCDGPIVTGSPLSMSSVLFALSGRTLDNTGATLGNCRVVVFETGRIQKDGTPVVNETISDGSGNYSLSVPMNTAYQATAYLPGSPDVAGITRNDLTPVAVG